MYGVLRKKFKLSNYPTINTSAEKPPKPTNMQNSSLVVGTVFVCLSRLALRRRIVASCKITLALACFGRLIYVVTQTN